MISIDKTVNPISTGYIKLVMIDEEIKKFSCFKTVTPCMFTFYFNYVQEYFLSSTIS